MFGYCKFWLMRILSRTKSCTKKGTSVQFFFLYEVFQQHFMSSERKFFINTKHKCVWTLCVLNLWSDKTSRHILISFTIVQRTSIKKCLYIKWILKMEFGWGMNFSLLCLKIFLLYLLIELEKQAKNFESTASLMVLAVSNNKYHNGILPHTN